MILDGLKEVLRQQKAIGNNLNQLAVLANMGKVQFANLDSAVQEFAKINTSSAGSCRREVRRNRNRPFRELQKGHADARLHEKCHALRFADSARRFGMVSSSSAALAASRKRRSTNFSVRSCCTTKTAA